MILKILFYVLGGTLVITYLIYKIIELKKFKKLVKLGIEHGLTEAEARKNAKEALSRKKQKEEAPNVNDNDDYWED